MSDGSISILISLRVGETSVSSVFMLPISGSLYMVRKGGLEPPHLSVPDPKSGASANSATFACKSAVKNSTEARYSRKGARDSLFRCFDDNCAVKPTRTAMTILDQHKPSTINLSRT